MLRKIRIVVAAVLFALITFYFLDFANLLPLQGHALAHIQVVPALLSGMVVVLALLLLLTLLLGRIYCSVICPMGIFQDVIAWFSRKVNRKKCYAYSKEKRILRVVITLVVLVVFLLGGTFLLSLLDPYSAYGRMVTNVFRPVYMAGNNLLAWTFNSFDSYRFYHTEVFVLSFFSLLIGVITFLVVVFLAYRHGRTYCNTICPVGTILGYLSQYSLLKVRINPEACGGCGLCEMKCKASCIDSKEKKIDYTRCVDCYNCLTVCKKKALSYGFVHRKAPVSGEPDQSKRRFVATLALTAVVVPKAMAEKGVALVKNNKTYQKEHPLSPPGSVSAARLLQNCTACHLCVTKCPSRVLKPAFMEYGLGGMMQPMMNFEHGFCNFDCTVCSDVCPNKALLKITKEEKHTLQVGRVVFVRENCIVNTDETSCGACSEHCPTQAVSMQPYKNGLTIPTVNPDICVGCGGCEYVCPVRPFRAIYIEGNPEHLQATPFKEAEKKEVQLDDFGF